METENSPAQEDQPRSWWARLRFRWVAAIFGTIFTGVAALIAAGTQYPSLISESSYIAKLFCINCYCGSIPRKEFDDWSDNMVERLGKNPDSVIIKAKMKMKVCKDDSQAQSVVKILLEEADKAIEEKRIRKSKFKQESRELIALIIEKVRPHFDDPCNETKVQEFRMKLGIRIIDLSNQDDKSEQQILSYFRLWFDQYRAKIFCPLPPESSKLKDLDGVYDAKFGGSDYVVPQ